MNFHKWDNWKKIPKICKIVVFDRNGFKSSVKPVGMEIADIEFQGSRVKVLLNKSHYQLFNVLMSDTDFYKKDLEIGKKVSCFWNSKDLHPLQEN